MACSLEVLATSCLWRPPDEPSSSADPSCGWWVVELCCLLPRTGQQAAGWSYPGAGSRGDGSNTIRFLQPVLLLLRLGRLNCPVFRFSDPSFYLLRPAGCSPSLAEFFISLAIFSVLEFLCSLFTAGVFIDTPCLYRHCSLVSFSSWSIFEIIDSESVSCKTPSGLPQR